MARRRALAWAASSVTALLAAACGHTPPAKVAAPSPQPAPVSPAGDAPRGPGPVPAPAPPPPLATTGSSQAATARDYRRDAARHLYGRHADRIYRGRLPPMLQAVGVLQVELDAAGQVRRIEWMRAPRHVPRVMTEIERLIRAAAPFPAPARLGRVTYTETWLWHHSGRFQLDTLTEGQD